MSIDYTSGYSASWRVFKVDPVSWNTISVLEGVSSISINRDGNDDVPLLETASMSIDLPVDAEFETGWYRIELIGRQNGSYSSEVMGTFLFEANSSEINHGFKNLTCSGYSTLKPADLRYLTKGDYAPKNVNGAEYAASLLRQCIPAPVNVIGDGFQLSDYVVFDVGTSYLRAVWDVLDAGKWVIFIDGDGTVNIQAKPTTPSLNLDYANAELIEPGVQPSADRSNVPNRYYAIDGDRVEVAVNDNDSSPVSYAKRGFYVDYVDSSPTRVNNETLYNYARRRLEEESVVLVQRTYTRDYMPGVRPFSLVYANFPQVDLVGDMTVTTQVLNLDHGVSVQETAVLEVKEWTR